MTRIEHLTESGLLARITPGLAQGSDVELGPGDDAAVVRMASPRLVITTDTLTEGHDFLLRATRPEWIGRKAAVQNLADVAAMGARPQAVVVSVSAPRETSSELLEGISRGLDDRCAREGASVVGGDLGAADALSITVTAVGALPEGQAPIRRDGARPGQVLALGSPLIGRSAAGLALVLAGRGEELVGRISADGSPADGDSADEDSADGTSRATGPDMTPEGLVAWHDAPDPEIAPGWTVCPGRARAMLDVSDGLARDGGRIARASGVVLDLDRAVLAADAAALAPAADLLAERTDPWHWVLGGGEEHALLAAFEEGEVPPGFRRIGRVRVPAPGEESGVVLDGTVLSDLGFDHFG
ncbi:thiamine-phosphate kinase [Brachybacterium sp. MASK1Z-5]|uniref:Thiamine-monophosphate kinase n=1 Tax=Brachybacterium halotolerans TaxID=2795215 RepID=A0ABS1B6N0_9MICO|nr:thiamine-phosphate kinase [Brachybacterium halotolerans]MBK0330270.1 thiamine-phosphate kinase [Brachybacterium halotolerans]